MLHGNGEFLIIHGILKCNADESIFQGRIALHAAPKEYQTVKHLWIPPRYMSKLTSLLTSHELYI